MTGRETPPSRAEGAGPKSFDDYELTLGDLMRGERATLGKSLLDVQREVKIKAEYLAAIEDADLSAFETPGFISGYVKSYARYLGMNPDWVYRRFCEESGFSHVEGLDARVFTTKSAGPVPRGAAAQPTRQKRAPDPGDAILARSPIYAATASRGVLGEVRAGAVGSLVVLAALIGALGYGGWQVLEEVQRVQVAPVDTALTTVPQPAAAAGETLVAENAAPTPEALERLYRPRPLDRPILTPRDAPIATLDPASEGLYADYRPAPDAMRAPPVPQPAAQVQTAGAEGDPVAAEPAVAESPAGPPPPRLALFAVEPVWMRVRDGEGAVLFEGTLGPGDSYEMPQALLPEIASATAGTDAGDVAVAAPPPTLRAGNSGALYFAVSGEIVGPAGAPGSVASNVALTPAALRERYAAVDPASAPRLAELAAPLIAPRPPAAAAPSPAEVQVVSAPPSEVVLFARRPAWVRVTSADGTVLMEQILEQGERYVLPATEQPPRLRAGNSGSLFFAVNGQTVGPAGQGTSVAKDIVLSAEALTAAYRPADLSQDPELARLAALVVATAEPAPPAASE